LTLSTIVSLNYAEGVGPTTRKDPATEAWQLLLELWWSERPPRFPAVAGEFGLSPMGLGLLKRLEPGAELPMSTMAECLCCDASNVTSIVDRLGARGLIERRDSPKDRRVKLLALTAEGEALRERAMARLHDPPEALVLLSVADQRVLRDTLRRALAPELPPEG